jgi:hypothetical protein
MTNHWHSTPGGRTVTLHLRTLGIVIHGLTKREYRQLTTRYQREVLRRKPLIHKGGKP